MATLLGSIVLFVFVVFSFGVVSGDWWATHCLFQLLLGLGKRFVVESEITKDFMHDLIIFEFIYGLSDKLQWELTYQSYLISISIFDRFLKIKLFLKQGAHNFLFHFKLFFLILRFLIKLPLYLYIKIKLRLLTLLSSSSIRCL